MQTINTEFGEIPNTWDVKKVKDIGRVVTGKTPPTKEPDFYGKEFLFVRIPDMGRNVRIKESSVMLSKKGAECISSSRLPLDSVMVSCIATIGNIGITSQDSFTNQQINTVIPNTKVIRPEWIYYFFKLHTDYLESLGGGGSVYTNISKGKFENASIAVPPLSEQRAIAKILGDLDEKIELNQQMNKTLESIAQAMFKRWFVDFEFPGYEKAKFIDGLPEGWREGEIKDCCLDIKNGGTPRRDQQRFWDGGNIPWITSGEVRQPIITSTENFITDEGMDASSAKWVEPFSTVVALYGATAGQVSFVSRQLTTNQAVCSLIPKNNFTFYNYLRMRAAVGELENKAVGSAQQNISKAIVEEIPVLVPSAPILEQFDHTVRPIFLKWILNVDESETLSQIRDSLLPKLMSGKIRVK